MKIEKLEIEIQKDLNKFKEEIFFGLSFKQLMHVVAGSVIGLALYGVLRIIGVPFIKEILVVLVSTPIFVAGFFEYQGLNLREFLENILQFYSRNKVLLYEDYTIEELIRMEGDYEGKK